MRSLSWNGLPRHSGSNICPPVAADPILVAALNDDLALWEVRLGGCLRHRSDTALESIGLPSPRIAAMRLLSDDGSFAVACSRAGEVAICRVARVAETFSVVKLQSFASQCLLGAASADVCRFRGEYVGASVQAGLLSVWRSAGPVYRQRLKPCLQPHAKDCRLIHAGGAASTSAGDGPTESLWLAASLPRTPAALWDTTALFTTPTAAAARASHEAPATRAVAAAVSTWAAPLRDATHQERPQRVWRSALEPRNQSHDAAEKRAAASACAADASTPDAGDGALWDAVQSSTNRTGTRRRRRVLGGLLSSIGRKRSAEAAERDEAEPTAMEPIWTAPVEHEGAGAGAGAPLCSASSATGSCRDSIIADGVLSVTPVPTRPWHVVTAHASGRLRVWDVASGEVSATGPAGTRSRR